MSEQSDYAEQVRAQAERYLRVNLPWLVDEARPWRLNEAAWKLTTHALGYLHDHPTATVDDVFPALAAPEREAH